MNNCKIVGELEKKAIELSKNNIIISRAGEILGVSKETYKSWLIKNNLPIPKTIHKDQEARDKFISICREAISNNQKIQLNPTLRQIKLSAGVAQELIKQYNLRNAIRTKIEGILQDKTLSLEEAQSRLPNQEDKVIGFENGKYKIQANDGSIYYKTSAKLYQGNPKGKSGGRLSVEYIRDELLKIGYKLIEESYDIKKKALKAICLKCNNIRTNRFTNFSDQQCPVCSNNGTSRQENEVREWIRSLNFNPIKYQFEERVTRPKEIDVYIPELKIGIEYCGLYYHNENRKEQNYHYNKMKQANSDGIRLITIFEDEWVHRNFQVKNFLKSILGICDKRIFARKCEIKEIDKKIAREFIDTYHIQLSSTISAHAAFGLIYENELVGVVSGSKYFRNNEQYDNYMVLNRLVFRDGYQVIGGASRLLNSLINYAKNNNYRGIISWSDNRWSEGNVYQKCGFTLVGELDPDYSYVIGTAKRVSNQSFDKERLLLKGAVGETELEMANSLGYIRIYDCGKKRWAITF